MTKLRISASAISGLEKCNIRSSKLICKIKSLTSAYGLGEAELITCSVFMCNHQGSVRLQKRSRVNCEFSLKKKYISKNVTSDNTDVIGTISKNICSYTI